MGSLLPLSLRDHFDFAEAFDELGRQVFPGDWTGEEAHLVGRDPVLSPEAALGLWREGEATRGVLRERGGRYNNGDIRDIVTENEDTGDFDIELINDDPHDAFSWPKLVKRLFSVIEYFSGKPGPDSSEYDELHKAYVRGTDALDAMLTLLTDGKVQALYNGKCGPAVIEAGLWGAQELNIDVAHSAITPPDALRPMEGVKLQRADFTALLKKLTTSKDMPAKLEAADAAEAELVKLMSDRSQPRLSKSDVFSKFKRRWQNLSRHDFDLCWKIACRKTKSGWDKKGRPKRPVGQSQSALEMRQEIPR